MAVTSTWGPAGLRPASLTVVVVVVMVCVQSVVAPPARAAARTAVTVRPGTAVAAASGSSVPAVGEVGPSGGPVAGGMVVSVTGSGFEGATMVRFGGVPASSFNVISGQQGVILDAIAPPHPNGPVAVTVTTPAGTSAVSADSTFTYRPVDGHWTSLQADRRYGHTATVLGDGKVLIAGGCVTPDPSGACTIATATAELYDPARRSFTKTGSMTRPRIGHTAVLLRDGKVLVTGGCPTLRCLPVQAAVRSAELYDPASRTWAPTGDRPYAQNQVTATLLPAGPVSVCGSNCSKVLVVGPAGRDNGQAAPSDAELYDPRHGTWSSTRPLQFRRDDPVTVRLGTGNVLVRSSSVEGQGNQATPDELFDPAAGTWSPTGNTEPIPPGSAGSGPATLLADGRVLVPGPANNGGSALYDPLAHPDPANPAVRGGKWTTAAPLLGGGDDTAVRLHDGKVLAVGGFALSPPLRSTGGSPPIFSAVAQLYDETTGTWSFAATMAGARHTVPGLGGL